MSRENDRVASTRDTLNDDPICTYDAHTDYLQATYSEKHCVICGPEFGLENFGEHVIIVSTFMASNLLELTIGKILALLWKR